MPQAKFKKILLRVIPIIFYILLVAFLFFYIKSLDFSQLSNAQIAWPFLFIALVLGLCFRYWGVFIWFVLLRSLGAKKLTATVELVYVYAKSWMGRYIPGTAPWILGKIYFASKHGISKNKLAVSSLLEGALQVVVLMVLSFIMLFFDPRLDTISSDTKFIMAGVITAGIIAMIPAVFNRVISAVYKIVKKKRLDKEHLVNGPMIFKGASLYVFGALINGLSLFFIAKAFYPELGFDNLLFVMGAGNLAGALGMIAIFAPSGIGVREGVQLLLLSIVMPAEFALIITVATRIYGVVMDVVFWGLSKALVLVTKKSKA